MYRLFLATLMLSLSGCGAGSGPATTNTSSASLPTLQKKVEFFEKYVTFRRTYQSLDFLISYQNGGSFPPSPADWDIRMIAQIPPAELPALIPSAVTAAKSADTSWLAAIPNGANVPAITEWYVEPRRLIGVDRAKSIIVYRSWSQ